MSEDTVVKYVVQFSVAGASAAERAIADLAKAGESAAQSLRAVGQAGTAANEAVAGISSQSLDASADAAKQLAMNLLAVAAAGQMAQNALNMPSPEGGGGGAAMSLQRATHGGGSFEWMPSVTKNVSHELLGMGSAMQTIDVAPIESRWRGFLDFMNKDIPMTRRQIRSIAVVAGGVALDAGVALARASGNDKAADLMQNIGGGALQGGMMGFMTGGPWGALAGAILGAGGGAAKTFFSGLGADVKESAEEVQKLEGNRKSVTQILIGKNNFEADMALNYSTDSVASTLTTLKRDLENLQQLSARGVIPQESITTTRAQISALTSEIKTTTDRLSELRAMDISRNNFMLDRFSAEIGRVTSKDSIFSQIQRLGDDKTMTEKLLGRGAISPDKMNETKENLRVINMQIALLTERYEELQKTEETLGLISFGRFTREAADIKTSQQAQGQISTLKNDILDMEAKINGGIFDAKKLEEANNELQRMTSMVEFLATVRDIRIGEEFMDKNLKSVQDNLKLMNSVEGGDTRVDALSAKGWGSVGANMMQGVEVLQREANGLLRTIGTVVDRIAQDRQMQAVYS